VFADGRPFGSRPEFHPHAGSATIRGLGQPEQLPKQETWGSVVEAPKAIASRRADPDVGKGIPVSGAFGKSPKDDGVIGTTRAADKSGVFGSNEAKTAPPAGGPGGSGVFGLTTAPSAAGVSGANNHPHKGVGVQGNGPEGGVSGFSPTAAGVRGNSSQGNGGEMFAHDPNATGLLAMNDATTAPTAKDSSPHGCGVLGVTTALGAAGVFGANNSDQGVGVQGNGPHAGLSGYSQAGCGVRGFSVQSNGVEGFAEGDVRLGKLLPGMVGRASLISKLLREFATDRIGRRRTTSAAVSDRLIVDENSVIDGGVSEPAAEAGPAPGSLALSVAMAKARGWLAEGSADPGFGKSVGVRVSVADHIGLVAKPDNRPSGNGVWGHTKVKHGSGVFGSVGPGLTQAAGVTGIGATAGQFFGNVVVTNALNVGGDINVGGDVRLSGADVAESFSVADVASAIPGSVMVIDQDGALTPAASAYDKAVAGVISGAGTFQPAIVLDSLDSERPQATIALVGKVYCRVDAQYGAIAVGDLLTTSPTRGHAMRAADPARAFGSVLGKALGPAPTGQTLIPILIALH
jgi:hypothetical protein